MRRSSSVMIRACADGRWRSAAAGNAGSWRRANYEARRYGVHFAMAVRHRAAKLPRPGLRASRFEVYRAVSRQIHEIFARYTRLVQPLSLDEAYLDVTTPLVDRGSATAIAEEIRAGSEPRRI